MPTLSDRERELFTEPHFAAFATMTEDGTPHVSTVWVDVDGDLILVNSAEGRSKTENARSRPEAGVSVFRMSNPYENVSVRGRIVEVTTDGAEAHIDAMARKYLGQDEYPYRAPGEERVLIKIRPDVVTSLFMEG